MYVVVSLLLYCVVSAVSPQPATVVANSRPGADHWDNYRATSVNFAPTKIHRPSMLFRLTDTFARSFHSGGIYCGTAQVWWKYILHGKKTLVTLWSGITWLIIPPRVSFHPTLFLALFPVYSSPALKQTSCLLYTTSSRRWSWSNLPCMGAFHTSWFIFWCDVYRDLPCIFYPLVEWPFMTALVDTVRGKKRCDTKPASSCNNRPGQTSKHLGLRYNSYMYVRR